MRHSPLRSGSLPPPPRQRGRGTTPKGWWRGRRTQRAARVFVTSKHVRSLPLAKRIFRDENEAPRPAPPPPRFARCASSSGPPPPLRGGGGCERSRPHNAIRVGVTCRASCELRESLFPIHHSPLVFVFPQKERGGGTPANAGYHRRILRCGARSFGARTPDGVPPRLSPKGIIPSQRLGFRPGFLGRGLNGRYPPSPVPVQGAPPAPVIVPGD